MTKISDVLSGWKEEREEDPPMKVKLSRRNRRALSEAGVRPWSLAPPLETLVGFEPGTEKRRTVATMVTTAFHQMDAKESVPVLIFQGAPGVGKTFTAVALCRSIGVDWQIVKRETIVTEYVGESERKLASQFIDAAKEGRRRGRYQFLIIDEAENLFSRRVSSKWENDPRLIPVFNEFINGVRTAEIAGTQAILMCVNRPDIMEPSVLSRGQILTFGPPSPAEIKRLLLMHTHGMGRAVADDVDFDAVAGLLARQSASHRRVVAVADRAHANASSRASGADDEPSLMQAIERMRAASKRTTMTMHDVLSAIAACPPETAFQSDDEIYKRGEVPGREHLDYFS